MDRTVQAQAGAFFSGSDPGLDLPLGDSSAVFGMGGTAFVGMQYALPTLPLFFAGSLGYDYDSLNGGVPFSVSVTSANIGAGLIFAVAPWLTFQTGVSGGYSFSFMSDFSASGGAPFVAADAGIVLLPGPFHVDVGASYRYYFDLYGGIDAFIGASYDLTPASPTAPARPQGQRSPHQGLDPERR